MPRRNAVTNRVRSAGDKPLRNPITGIADCCACAASGHAVAAPPSAASNSRRPMVTVIRPSRVRCVKGRIPRHERGVFFTQEQPVRLLHATRVDQPYSGLMLAPRITCPLCRVVRDELLEVGGRAAKHRASLLDKPGLDN